MTRDHIVWALHSLRGAADALEDAIERIEEHGVASPELWTADLTALLDRMEAANTSVRLLPSAVHHLLEKEKKE